MILKGLANQINWSVFDEKFGTKGRPGKSTRLMVGLHYLKYAFDESDESVVDCLLENGYWQYFCGFDFFIHDLPLDPSMMTRWRQRIGFKNMTQLLSETLETAKYAYCDKGFKGNPKQLDTTNIHLANRRKSSMKPSGWRWFKRRSAIETVIGHMKQDKPYGP